MDGVLKDLSATALARAVEENMAGYYRVLECAPGVEVSETPEMFRVCTGLPHPQYNGVFLARLTPEAADTTIHETMAFFRSRQVPWGWTIGPTTRPVDLGQRLEAHGFEYVREMPGMAADLHSLPNMPAPPGLHIVEVKDDAAFEEWLVPSIAVFRWPPAGTGLMRAAQRHRGFTPDSPVRYFVGYEDGRAVTTAQLILAAGVAGVYSVATLREARGKGYGGAITAASLRVARELGYRAAVLVSSDMGYHVYQRLGFRECCRLRFYGMR